MKRSYIERFATTTPSRGTKFPRTRGGQVEGFRQPPQAQLGLRILDAPRAAQLQCAFERYRDDAAIAFENRPVQARLAAALGVHFQVHEEQPLADDAWRDPGGRTQPLEVGLQRQEAELFAQLAAARTQDTPRALFPWLDQPGRQLPERAGLARAPRRARRVTKA
jgi:hypothetical protein